MTTQLRSVHIASLGCARNDVDSEELAARLELGGFTLVCAAGLFALLPWTQRKMADIEEMKRRAADGARTVA